MILVIIRMNAPPEKRLELVQTIVSLISAISTAEGCRRCSFCQGIDHENQFFLMEEWDIQENLKTHLKSDHFHVLRGAMGLLKEPPEMMSYTIFQPA